MNLQQRLKQTNLSKYQQFEMLKFLEKRIQEKKEQKQNQSQLKNDKLQKPPQNSFSKNQKSNNNSEIISSSKLIKSGVSKLKRGLKQAKNNFHSPSTELALDNINNFYNNKEFAKNKRIIQFSKESKKEKAISLIEDVIGGWSKDDVIIMAEVIKEEEGVDVEKELLEIAKNNKYDYDANIDFYEFSEEKLWDILDRLENDKDISDEEKNRIVDKIDKILQDLENEKGDSSQNFEETKQNKTEEKQQNPKISQKETIKNHNNNLSVIFAKSFYFKQIVMKIVNKFIKLNKMLFNSNKEENIHSPLKRFIAKEVLLFNFVIMYTIIAYIIIEISTTNDFNYLVFNPIGLGRYEMAKLINTYIFLGIAILIYLIRPIILILIWAIKILKNEEI